MSDKDFEVGISDGENSKGYSDEIIENGIFEEILGNSKIKDRFNKMQNELNYIKNEIKKNNKKIERIKSDLIKLKEDKNQQKRDIINLLSKKESLEEVYKNQIFSLNNKNEKNNNYNKDIPLFNISFEEFKQIEIDKYIELVLLMTDDILSICNINYIKKDINNSLKNIIKNSYEIFVKNSTITNFDFLLNNFISKISLYISNQSYGKYSEKDINILLSYLMNIDITSDKIEKMGKFVNKQYKETKMELKDEIKNLENKNEILSKLYGDLKKIIDESKNKQKEEQFHLQKFNFNINNINSNNNQIKNKNNIVDKQIYINYNNTKNLDINTDPIKNLTNSKINEKEKDNIFNKDIDKYKIADSNNNRVIKGKKIKREIICHIDNKTEKNFNSDQDSFNKNINYLSDDESENGDNNNVDKNSKELSQNQKISNTDLNFSKENNLLDKKIKRIHQILEELEASEFNKNKGNNNNFDIKIYNKKSIKLNNINKNNEVNSFNINSKNKQKLVNIDKIEYDIKKTNEVIDIFEKKKIMNNKKRIINDKKENNNSQKPIDEIENKNIEIKKKNITNNRSFDSIFNDFDKSKNNEMENYNKNKSYKNTFNPKKIEEKKMTNDINGIYYNKKKKGGFIKTNVNIKDIKNINNLTENDNINSNNTNSIYTQNNKIKINKNILQNLVKTIKSNLLKSNDNDNTNITTEFNILDNNKNNEEKSNIKINTNFAEDIINKLLIPRNGKLNDNNLTDYSNKRNSKEKSENRNLKRFITKNEVISNNINNNNEITLPISNQPISNRISKLNLNIFITQNKENNNRLPEINILNETNIKRKRNKEYDSNSFNGNGIEGDNVINGLSKENMINSDDNINNEEKLNIDEKNYRKLHLNKKLYDERKRILINTQFFSSNKGQSKRTRKIKNSKNHVYQMTDLNQEKKLKSRYSLFYNTHDFTINNNYEESINKSKKKQNKSLIKDSSNSKTSHNKYNKKNNNKYIDISYLNKFNNSLLKSNNSIDSYPSNDKKIVNKRNLFLSLKSMNKNNKNDQEYKNILFENDKNENKNIIKNKNNKNKIIRLCQNKSGTFNNTLNTNNTNIGTISNYSTNKNNKLISIKKRKDINIKNKNNKNDLKKLIEKNLKNIIPTNTIKFNPKKIFAEGVMESFCYFKILDKDSPKFNPLDSCTINPESLGYSEGYISLDVILGHFRIIPKSTMSKNFKSNNKNCFLSHNNSLSMAEYTLFNNGNNVFRFEIDKNEKKNCIRIDLKNINQVKIGKQMQDIIKIHKIFLKYNSNSDYELGNNNNGRTKRKVLSINKLLYMKEVSEINMDQNEKIKAALCNFFAFTIIFGNYKINKVECIFINYDLFNIWNKCLEMIAENNNKSKNSLATHRGLLHKKHNSNIYYSINN